MLKLKQKNQSNQAIKIRSHRPPPQQIEYQGEQGKTLRIYTPTSSAPTKKASPLFKYSFYLVLAIFLSLGTFFYYLNTSTPNAKNRVFQAIHHFLNQQQLDGLNKSIYSPEKEIRLEAIKILGEMKSLAKSSLEDLAEIKEKDEEEKVRKFASWAITEIEKDIAKNLKPGSHKKKISKTAKPITRQKENPKIAKKPIKVTKKVTKKEQPTATKIAKKIVREKKPAKIVVKTPSPIRVSTNNENAISLIKNLKNNNSQIRSEARFALGAMGKEALPDLKASWKVENYDVRREIGLVFAKIGEPAVPFLIEELQDKNWSNRFIATDALGDIGSNASQAIPFLIQNLKDSNKSVQETTLKTLGEMGDSGKVAAPALLKELNSNATYNRILAAEALLKIETETSKALSTLEQIKKHHDNEKLRKEASNLLNNYY